MQINHGDTDPVQKIIRIREDVYEGACNDKGRDRFTVAHEVGHALLHCGQISLNRQAPDIDIPTFRDPEWHAQAFAGELLIPFHLIKGMSIQDIVNSCCVSYDAARYQQRRQ